MADVERLVGKVYSQIEVKPRSDTLESFKAHLLYVLRANNSLLQ